MYDDLKIAGNQRAHLYFYNDILLGLTHTHHACNLMHRCHLDLDTITTLMRHSERSSSHVGCIKIVLMRTQSCLIDFCIVSVNVASITTVCLLRKSSDMTMQKYHWLHDFILHFRI